MWLHKSIAWFWYVQVRTNAGQSSALGGVVVAHATLSGTVPPTPLSSAIQAGLFASTATQGVAITGERCNDSTFPVFWG